MKILVFSSPSHVLLYCPKSRFNTYTHYNYKTRWYFSGSTGTAFTMVKQCSLEATLALIICQKIRFLSPSYLNPSLPKADRWNITGLTRYDVNHKQRIKLNINRASDTTYITRYPLNRKASPSQNKNLTSSLIFEQFEPNQYFVFATFYFKLILLKLLLSLASC